MKVFDIQCSQGHIFEGWFASEDDFQKQCSGVLIECPFCGDTTVHKRLTAPRLNAKSNQKITKTSQKTKDHTSAVQLPTEEMQQLWTQVVDHVMKNTEDVGDGFAEEARRIHYGEAPKRGIRGQTTVEQALELDEEGIDVMPIGILPSGGKGSVQ